MSYSWALDGNPMLLLTGAEAYASTLEHFSASWDPGRGVSEAVFPCPSTVTLTVGL